MKFCVLGKVSQESSSIPIQALEQAVQGSGGVPIPGGVPKETPLYSLDSSVVPGAALKFNKARCKFLQQCQGNPKHKFRLDGEGTGSSPGNQDLSVLVDETFNIPGHVHWQPRKPNMSWAESTAVWAADEGYSAPLLHSDKCFVTDLAQTSDREWTELECYN
ncbi:hypothetical protein WISP_55117 [Willisornis vidua]|uniref:Uncharacterized protein n=1 Tax=Willisornis vidua TaxID=1566151 RepID=A0ABQ9DGY0_9PASS|nr:hypothetical protein WISP_55117 [Willisornis vidua]